MRKQAQLWCSSGAEALAEARDSSREQLHPAARALEILLENDDAVQRARDAGTLRMGTVDSFLCDRLGADAARPHRVTYRKLTRD